MSTFQSSIQIPSSSSSSSGWLSLGSAGFSSPSHSAAPELHNGGPLMLMTALIPMNMGWTGCKTRSHNAEVITAIKSCHVVHDLLATDAQGYCVTAAGHAWVGPTGTQSMNFCSMRHMRTFSLQTRYSKTPNTPAGFWY